MLSWTQLLSQKPKKFEFSVFIYHLFCDNFANFFITLNFIDQFDLISEQKTFISHFPGMAFICLSFELLIRHFTYKFELYSWHFGKIDELNLITAKISTTIFGEIIRSLSLHKNIPHNTDSSEVYSTRVHRCYSSQRFHSKGPSCTSHIEQNNLKTKYELKRGDVGHDAPEKSKIQFDCIQIYHKYRNSSL